jgi:DnaD/phage-associated family protein
MTRGAAQDHEPTLDQAEKRLRGFPVRGRWTPLPDLFFSRYLPALTDGVQIKAFLHFHWRVYRRPQHRPPAVRVADLVTAPALRRGVRALGVPLEAIGSAIHGAVGELMDAGLVLAVEEPVDGETVTWLLPNTHEGRTARARLLAGELALGAGGPALAPEEAPAGAEEPTNIFVLYEENIGPVTPLLAEELKEAESVYPDVWILDAFRIALERNVRKWSYIRAILEGWRVEGRSDESDRQRGAGTRGRYLEGEFGEYVKH